MTDDRTPALDPAFDDPTGRLAALANVEALMLSDQDAIDALAPTTADEAITLIGGTIRLGGMVAAGLMLTGRDWHDDAHPVATRLIDDVVHRRPLAALSTETPDVVLDQLTWFTARLMPALAVAQGVTLTMLIDSTRAVIVRDASVNR